jgi:hypothetical protein
MGKPPSSAASGHLGLPAPVSGAISRWESRAVLENEEEWRVVYDAKTKLATVFNDAGETIGWTEGAGKGIRQVVLPGEVKPPVYFEDRWLGRRVWIDGVNLKPVMSLEGRKRVFGNDRIRLEHRDFASEVRFVAAPDLLVAAALVAFEVYARALCGGRSE